MDFSLHMIIFRERIREAGYAECVEYTECVEYVECTEYAEYAECIEYTYST